MLLYSTYVGPGRIETLHLIEDDLIYPKRPDLRHTNHTNHTNHTKSYKKTAGTLLRVRRVCYTREREREASRGIERGTKEGERNRETERGGGRKERAR